MSIATLVVSEVFGPTVQGEGPSTGRRCAFVRLGACNLTCTWCDTPYTWDASRHDLREELTRLPVDSVLAELERIGAGMVVISGGEPLLQQDKGLVELVWGLPLEMRIEVETNGTIAPSPELSARCFFNVSPKLMHSGVTTRKRLRPEVLSAFRLLAHGDRACFKVVCRNTADLDELDALVEAHLLPRNKVWVMPEGVTTEQVEGHMIELADEAIARGYNLTTRLHVAIWNGERAR